MIPIGTYIDHDKYGKGQIVEINDHSYEVDFGKIGIYTISKSAEDSLRVLKQDKTQTNMNELESTLKKVLSEFSDISQQVDMADKWDGGTIILKPANTNQKTKEIPMDVFFHKIVMVRDRLRVMEQNINSHSKLSDADKVNLQQYITRIYGSLTTFNVLFKNNEDHFVGDKKSKDEE